MAIPWPFGGLSGDVEGNTVDFVWEAIVEVDGGAVFLGGDTEVEIERVFVEVLEELIVLVAI